MIRKLTPSDFTAWKSIRLEALKVHPEAFSGAYEEESTRSDDQWKQRLQDSVVFAEFDNERITGVVGYYRRSGRKDYHRAGVYATYLQKDYRGKGVMTALIDALSEHARSEGIEQLELDVNVQALEAIKCYAHNGFSAFGTKPRTIKIDGCYIDTYMMVKYL